MVQNKKYSQYQLQKHILSFIIEKRVGDDKTSNTKCSVIDSPRK